jgi:hypothetical protein
VPSYAATREPAPRSRCGGHSGSPAVFCRCSASASARLARRGRRGARAREWTRLAGGVFASAPALPRRVAAGGPCGCGVGVGAGVGLTSIRGCVRTPLPVVAPWRAPGIRGRRGPRVRLRGCRWPAGGIRLGLGRGRHSARPGRNRRPVRTGRCGGQRPSGFAVNVFAGGLDLPGNGFRRSASAGRISSSRRRAARRQRPDPGRVGQ